MKIFLKICTTKVVLFLKGCKICVICVICGSIFIFFIDKRIQENYNKIRRFENEKIIIGWMCIDIHVSTG